MRIRNSRNPSNVLAAIHRGPSSPLSLAPPCSVEMPLQPQSTAATAAATPPPVEVGICVVNMSSWDVTPLVLAFFQLDGLLQQQSCRSHDDHQQKANALEERHGRCRSDSLSLSISSFKRDGPDRRREKHMIGKEKQEGKRSKALCLKSEGSQDYPTTIHRGHQNSSRRAPKKGEEGSAAVKGRWSAEVKRSCKREDGKGWHCGNEAKAGSSLCDHHLSQVRSYCKRPSNGSRGGAEKQPFPPQAEGGGRRKRPTLSSSSMGSYYYYTGFGPAWRETKRKRVSAVAEDDGTTDDDKEEEDEDEEVGVDDGIDDEDGGKSKSRGRKRVKCRSLRSLL